MKLEDLQATATVRGILADAAVSVVSVRWFGSQALELTYRTAGGELGSEILYRDDEVRLEIAKQGRPWSFDGDGELFRLVSEALRIRLAHLFDPALAVHTSLVEPLPHQITAVYEAMLPRQPLRFLLADDPGAGKTIMAGLLMKELIARGDLQRCLVVCPGSLAEQWQDELYRRFHLNFEIFTNDKLAAARTGNWFLEADLVIARLDKLARDAELQDKLQAPDCRWDLIVCDEAHKMAATFTGGEVKYTKRYRLGQLLGRLTRHFLLLTATPAQRQGGGLPTVHGAAGRRPLRGAVPRRRPRGGCLRPDAAHGKGAPAQVRRHAAVPRARGPHHPLSTLHRRGAPVSGGDQLRARGVQPRRGAGQQQTGGHGGIRPDAAAAPPGIVTGGDLPVATEAAAAAGESPARAGADASWCSGGGSCRVAAWRRIGPDDIDDLEDAPAGEWEETAQQILDQATAARSSAELRAEIRTLRHVEQVALGVRRSGNDAKWRELAGLLDEIFSRRATGQAAAPEHARKLVIFTEHRDTLDYLRGRIATVLGRDQAVVVIHGGMGREERMKAQEAFLHDRDVQILLATDAAGEGINLQRAHLMVNYDLPWNPNRLEQRFGRIHRIGQTEVCHLWNLVADETREGDVYRRLLDKLEQARQTLGGQVFDVLGKLQFGGRPLRDLLLEAIRYGEQPSVRARLTTALEHALDRAALRDLLEEQALAPDAMDATRVQRVREELERAAARRLQPHYVESFFRAAFARLGGSIGRREPRRYEITHVPGAVRNRDRLIGVGEPVSARYERIAFDKARVSLPGKPQAAFVCPGHPLLDAVLDLTLERHRDLLKRGTVLVDEGDPSSAPRVLFYLEHAIQDASRTHSGDRRVVSKRLLYVELAESGAPCHLHYAPYLDYRPLTPDEPAVAAIMERPECAWITGDLEQRALEHAVTDVVPGHLDEVRNAKLGLIAKTEAAVKERLTKEIAYWDHRAAQLQLQDRRVAPAPGWSPARRAAAPTSCRHGSNSGCGN